MFGNLIESGSHKGERARKSSFFLGTLAVYTLAFLAIGVGSIYAYNTHVENQDLRLVSMVMPAEPPEAQTPQRKNSSKQSNGGNSSSRILVLRNPPVMTRIDPTLVQDNMRVAPHAQELPEGTLYRIGIPGKGDNIFGVPGDKDGSPGNNDAGGSSSKMDELVKATPPPPMKKEVAKPVESRTVSKGVINGQATYLPIPAYSAIAKAAHAYGTVSVQVLIDENGKVVSARALSGHPLLMRESVQAAYQARFTTTFLSNEPVKVSGIITYNFVLQ